MPAKRALLGWLVSMSERHKTAAVHAHLFNLCMHDEDHLCQPSPIQQKIALQVAVQQPVYKYMSCQP